jgi:hypothetical protein
VYFFFVSMIFKCFHRHDSCLCLLYNYLSDNTIFRTLPMAYIAEVITAVYSYIVWLCFILLIRILRVLCPCRLILNYPHMFCDAA